MPQLTAKSDALDQQTAALLNAVEVLLEELSTLSGEHWEKLPELKNKLVVVASRVQQLPPTADEAPAAWIESLVANLEDQSRKNIRARLGAIGRQIAALQELDLYWRECLHVRFRRGSNQSLGN